MSAFFVAKNSIFAAVQVQKWHMHMEIQQGNAIVPSTIVFGQSLDNIQIRRGKVDDIRGKNPVEFWQRITNEAVDDIKDEDKVESREVLCLIISFFFDFFKTIRFRISSYSY